ncbi:hypothetical protein FJZ17_00420 [Candidatus Pacearchaeota archaeon]|nr:hypothetical protein [Candidatus Pacearchaeota archaeon]
MAYQAKQGEQGEHRLGVAIDPSVANQDFPRDLSELDLDLASVKHMPRPCLACREEMRLMAYRKPKLLAI